MAILEFSGNMPSPFEKEPELAGIYSWCDGNYHHRVMHMHEDFIEIKFVVSGTGPNIVGNEICYPQAGDIVIHDSKVLHDESLILGSNCSTFCLTVRGLKLPGQRENSLLPEGSRPIFPSGTMAEDFQYLYPAVQKYASMEGGLPIANQLAKSIVYMVYLLIHQNYNKIQQEDNLIVQRILEYINNHYSEDITLSSIAAAVHANAYYIAHLFKRVTNYSPLNYVIRRRIGEAQSLLIYTKMDITEIAAAVGYPDPNYFSRVFKKITSMSPRRYRQEWINQSHASTTQKK